MTQTQIQEQKLQQQQLLKLTQQQMLTMHLLEMPIARLEEDLEAMMDDNPAIEKDYDSPTAIAERTTDEDEYGKDYDYDDYNADYQEELTQALDNMARDDEMEGFDDGDEVDYSEENKNYMAFGETTSFYDDLMEQLGETELTDQERTVMEYLICSLDTDGLLRKDIDIISDELAIYHYIDVSEEEIERVLKKLQRFEPAGIGARSLQECLLLQIDRLPENDNTRMMREVIENHYDAFIKKHWDKIQSELGTSAEHTEILIQSLRKLNPKPGSALGEASGRSTDQITPDIIIEKDDDGRISFTISHGNLPELKISSDYAEEVKNYERIPEEKLSRQDLEAKAYYKEKIEKAQWYIDAIRQRYHTMNVCTRAIIRWQSRYFHDGDEAELRPMLLRDIAEKTGLDVSTVSRFSNQKYAETPWGIRPMRFFFTEAYTNTDGEETATRKVKLKLQEIIEGEDKRKPLSDAALTKCMAEAGMPIARRTVTKYREQLGIPVARLRK